MFTKSDLEQFKKKNISLENINHQIENFRNGFPFVKLYAAATPGNGIVVLDEAQLSSLENDFNEKSAQYFITKMVPASGAASRMFKSLFAFIEEEQAEKNQEVTQFLEKIEDFAFYPALQEVLAHDEYDLEQLLAEKNYKTVIKYLLTDIGLNYASLPKGLLMFHKYPEGARTPLEEHMREGLEYSKDKDGTVHLHFTVSPEHKKNLC